jgi:sulfite oxidase
MSSRRGGDSLGSRNGRVDRRALLKRGAIAGAATALGLGQFGRGEAAGLATTVEPERLVASPAEQEAERIVVNANPINAETPLWALEGLITPTRLFFIRDHFPPGQIAASEWQPRVEGTVERPFTLTYELLRQMPARRLVALIECAGNSRSRFEATFGEERLEGVRWGNGAVSTAEWVGVPLGMVLDMAGVQPGVQNVVIYGGERGNFARGLRIDKAYDPDTILAYSMNGEPLPMNHGAPVRLVVPGWIGVASVKWVGRIEVIDQPYDGSYNTQRYVFERPGSQERTPVTTFGVKSVIARPQPEAVLAPGPAPARSARSS